MLQMASVSLPEEGVQEVVRSRHASPPRYFVDCFLKTDAPAIRSTVQGDRPLNHSDLASVPWFLTLRQRGIGSDSVVAVVMPNGPELAVMLLACMCQTTVAPLDPAMCEEEFESAFLQLGVTHAIALREHTSNVYGNTLERACSRLTCQLHCILKVGQRVGSLAWVEPCLQQDSPKPHMTTMNDVVLLLRTSGTTSKPKVVPLTPCGLHTGAVCIGTGLSLGPQDIALNVMPLNHIGGISCSLLSSIFTGGSVICGPTFDPSLFLRWLELLHPSWYSAVPTIHKAVALVAKSFPEPLKHSLRLIRSGAAHLADADARDLHDIFKCKVLPSYSMTECMPIAQAPLSYDLSKPGTVGIPIGCSLHIAEGSGGVCSLGQDGEVCVRGPVVTSGYLHSDEANAACFFGQADETGCFWFRTGDVGHLDKDGFLYLTGRSKELIKRGGEQVSPFEVEEILLGHPAVQTAVVFGVPNPFWGEEVAAAVLLKSAFSQKEGPSLKPEVRPESNQSMHLSSSLLYASSSRPSQLVSPSELIEFMAKSLPDNKVPRQVVCLSSAESLPKTKTGKYMRAGLADHLALDAVDLSAMNNLVDIAAGTQQGLGPVKPKKAVYGLRFFLAIWVIFIHVGNFPRPIRAWRQCSISMPAFFILAGFLLASSSARPVRCAGELWNFYKNRIVAAHPLYIFAMLFTLPITLLICSPGLKEGDFATYMMPPPNESMPVPVPNVSIPITYRRYSPVGPAEALFCPAELHQEDHAKYWAAIVQLIAVVFFAQSAWPWGMKYNLRSYANNVVWFTSAYYFSLLLFPFLFWLMKRCSRSWLDSTRSLVRPCIVRYARTIVFMSWFIMTIFTIMAYVVAKQIVEQVVSDDQGPLQGRETEWPKKDQWWFYGAYMFPPVWCGEFFLGMLCFNLFEINRRGSEVYVWPHWGKLTDFMTSCILLMLPMASMLDVANPTVSQLFGLIYAGSGPVRCCTAFLCVWIYGLATGQGYTAKFLDQRLFVQHLGPASYAMYLFHLPIAWYWVMIMHPNISSMEPEEFSKYSWGAFVPTILWCDWWQYIMIVFLTTCWAVFCTEVLNAPLTSAFMRIIDYITWPCCRRRVDNEKSTLLKIAEAINGLSGAEVDATTLLKECGLDSFGTSALVGILRPKFPSVSLNPVMLYDLDTVGALACVIDDQLATGGSTHEGGEGLVSAAA